MQSIISLFVLSFILSCTTKKNDSNFPDAEQQDETMTPGLNIDYIMGKFDPSKHELFVEISPADASREGLLLRKEVYKAFKEMKEAAAREGVSLKILSATRNFDYQKGIWEAKWIGQTILSDGTKASDISDEKERALKILLYSSMPGTSRHHWGTDMDLNAFNETYFLRGEGAKMYQWMKDNASKYGFCQPYTDKSGGRTGYEEEKWHWSYQPISRELTAYSREHLKNEMIQGFQGASSAMAVDVVNNYVLGISMQCQ